MRAGLGLEPVGSAFEQMLRCDAVFVLSSPAFDFTSPAMPANVRYAGPVLDDPAWAAPWEPPWESDGGPLVLAGFGST